MKQTVWIARHGIRQDYHNRDWGKTAAWPDDPGLSPSGIVQAAELAERLRNEDISHIFSSPFLRTIETAIPTARALNLKLKIEAGLGEWHSARFYPEPGPVIMPIVEKAKLFPEIDLSYYSCITPKYPETSEAIKKRVETAIETIISKYSGNILLIGHGASVDAAAYYLGGKDIEINSSLCCLSKAVWDGSSWILELNNDACHLSNPVFDA